MQLKTKVSKTIKISNCPFMKRLQTLAKSLGIKTHEKKDYIKLRLENSWSKKIQVDPKKATLFNYQLREGVIFNDDSREIKTRSTDFTNEIFRENGNIVDVFIWEEDLNDSSDTDFDNENDTSIDSFYKEIDKGI